MKTLKDINGKHNFKIPQDYFEELENKLSFTSLNSSKSSYKIPEQYFDTVEKKISKKITQNSFAKHHKSWLVYASAIAAVILVALLAVNNLNTPNLDKSLKQIEIVSIERYLQTEQLFESDFADLNYKFLASDFKISTIKDDAVLDYLDDEFDINSLLID